MPAIILRNSAQESLFDGPAVIYIDNSSQAAYLEEDIVFISLRERWRMSGKGILYSDVRREAINRQNRVLKRNYLT